MKNIRKVLRSSFIAQVTSIFVSIGMGFILPRLMTVEDYAHWQLFALYSVCFELLLLGVPNGYFIRNAGINKIHYRYLKFSFVLLMLFNMFISNCIFSLYTYDETERIIYNLIAISIIIINSGTFFSLITRCNNEVEYDCIVTVILNVTIVALLILLYFTNKVNIKYILFIYIFSFFVRSIILIIHNKRIIFDMLEIKKSYMYNFFFDMFVGCRILVSDYTNILLFAVCRIIVKEEFGLITFAMISFSISLIILAVNFLNQLSLSTLPTLRTLDESGIKASYLKLRNISSSILLISFVLYKPIVYLLSLWLPKYNESHVYILLLFPLVVYEGKMQISFSLFLKILRKEDVLLKINTIYLITVTFIIKYLSLTIKSSEVLLIVIVLSSLIRGIVAELLLNRILNVKPNNYRILLEITLSCIFIFTNIYIASVLELMMINILYFISSYYNYKILSRKYK